MEQTKEAHTSGTHLKPVDSISKTRGLDGKNSDALGRVERKEVISKTSTQHFSADSMDN